MYHFEKKIQKFSPQRGPVKMFGGLQECFPGPAVAVDGPGSGICPFRWNENHRPWTTLKVTDIATSTVGYPSDSW